MPETDGSARADGKAPNYVALSAFWLAWEVQWAALLGAALQGEVARFFEPSFFGRASAVLGGLGAACAIASQYAAGRASDSSGRRMPLIVIGVALNIAGLFAFALAPSFAAVVAAFVFIQIAFNIAGGPYQALLPDLVDRTRHGAASAVMGLFRLGGNIVGLILARALVRQPGPNLHAGEFEHSLVVLVAVLAIIEIAALVITYRGVKDKPAAMRLGHSDPVPALHWPQKKSFAWLVASRTFVSLGLYSILPFLGFFLKFALGVSDFIRASVSLLIAMSVCSLIGTLPAGFLGDRVAKKPIVGAAIGFMAVGAVAFAFARDMSVAYPIALVLGIGWGAYYSVDWALACNLLPPGRAGAIMAIWNLGAAGPQVAAPVLGGLIVDGAAGALGFALAYRALFTLVGAFLVCGAACLAFVVERREGMRENVR